ncbi:zingipain-2-like [Dioscorea cayenensis subsp. rotundata]|uniref:Zingipain-2-like n=1 Tax=Dioscorea cayennensis subsp. rotundata TaxID=55577 RepID=A0AB40BYR1_DIOCR|nr:zingipain-2-like [Dioscorea cayenensis subsp. rotundata]
MPPLLLFVLSILFLFTYSYSSSEPIPFRSELEINLLFEGWLVKHNKTYKENSFEKAKRYDIFKDNLRYIDEHNSGNHTFTLFLNVFADLTVEEYRDTYLGSLPPLPKETVGIESDSYNDDFSEFISDDDLPNSTDWRDSGAVTTVKHQGACFCCWAFAAVAAVEGINQIVTGELISLSVQQIVDCQAKSCSKGYVDEAYKYIRRNGGIDSEIDYPYNGTYEQCDKEKADKKVVTIDTYQSLTESNEKRLKMGVAKQPVAVLIEAYERAFQLYGEGIFTAHCGTKVDHAVTIIGYGTQGDQDYWIIKNCWGDFWGEAGYMRIERNTESTKGKCGLAQWPQIPVKRKHTATSLE